MTKLYETSHSFRYSNINLVNEDEQMKQKLKIIVKVSANNQTKIDHTVYIERTGKYIGVKNILDAFDVIEDSINTCDSTEPGDMSIHFGEPQKVKDNPETKLKHKALGKATVKIVQDSIKYKAWLTQNIRNNRAKFEQERRDFLVSL